MEEQRNEMERECDNAMRIRIMEHVAEEKPRALMVIQGEWSKEMKENTLL